MFVPTSKVDSTLVPLDQYQGLVSAYTGSAERQSQPVKPKVSSGGDRMVAESMCGRINLVPVGPTAHLSFRHKRQSQVTDFSGPVSRRGGMGNARHVVFMGGNVGVRLPSVCSGPQSVGEDQSGTSRDNSSGGHIKSLVTRLARIEHGAAPGAPALGKTADTTQVG